MTTPNATANQGFISILEANEGFQMVIALVGCLANSKKLDALRKNLSENGINIKLESTVLDEWYDYQERYESYIRRNTKVLEQGISLRSLNPNVLPPLSIAQWKSYFDQEYAANVSNHYRTHVAAFVRELQN